MKIQNSHLSYCMNVHPGESWEQTRFNIEHYGKELKEFFPNKTLGLGLRLTAQALKESTKADIEDLKSFLEQEKLYAFTANIFPYGTFHGSKVKEEVYQPDWNTTERLEYSKNAADFLAELLPKDCIGSLSTVPITYGKKLPPEAYQNLQESLLHLAHIEEMTGKCIRLALEPEPDCYLETTDEFISFYNDFKKWNPELTQRYLGICLDTCHLALQFENLEESLEKLIANDIPIAKAQVSSVLKYHNTGDAPEQLKAFNEGIYLHQTRVQQDNGQVKQFLDLPEALKQNSLGEWRVHCHVPLYFESNRNGMSSTSELLTQRFLHKLFAHCPNIETETYTFDVLPGEKAPLMQAMSDEIKWLLKALEK